MAHRALGAAVRTRPERPALHGVLGPYAGTALRHGYVPIPFVIGQCRLCFGWAADPRHTTRKA